MNSSAKLTTLTRLGFAARGLLYLVIAWLIVRTGRSEDVSGALSYLAEGGGRVLLTLVAAGLVGYGLWRLSDAAFNIENNESSTKGLAKRAGSAASGFIHLFLAWQAVRLIRGGGGGGGGGGAEQGAATALALPGGSLLLLLGGLVLMVVGVVQLVKAAKGSFLETLDQRVANENWVKWAGRSGYAARGVVFLISGFFLLSAGFAAQASEAGGMEEALSWLTSPWDLIVGLGLAGFGLFSLVEARYRVIRNVSVDQAMSKAHSKLSV